MLRLSAPLQSWGVGSRGTAKDTLDEPTLSGVVGVVANAMGRTRDDDPSDLAGLWFGTRTDRAGERVSDFYTAGTTTGIAMRKETREPDGRRVFKDTVGKGGVVGRKEYLAGAHFTVVLAGDPTLVGAVAAALAAPARPLFLGRKACPVAGPLLVEMVPDCDPETVLSTYPTPADLYFPPGRRPSRVRIVVPAPGGPADPRAVARFDHPLNFSDRDRAYLPRYVVARSVAVTAPEGVSA